MDVVKKLLWWDRVVKETQIVEEKVKEMKDQVVYEKKKAMVNAGFNMVYCPAGEFWMGTDYNPLLGGCGPRHKVKITKGVWMGETQVTQELWEKVMGWNPSYFKGSAKLPVESVTWYDCLMFL